MRSSGHRSLQTNLQRHGIKSDAALALNSKHHVISTLLRWKLQWDMIFPDSKAQDLKTSTHTFVQILSSMINLGRNTPHHLNNPKDKFLQLCRHFVGLGLFLCAKLRRSSVPYQNSYLMANLCWTPSCFYSASLCPVLFDGRLHVDGMPDQPCLPSRRMHSRLPLFTHTGSESCAFLWYLQDIEGSSTHTDRRQHSIPNRQIFL